MINQKAFFSFFLIINFILFSFLCFYIIKFFLRIHIDSLKDLYKELQRKNTTKFNYFGEPFLEEFEELESRFSTQIDTSELDVNKIKMKIKLLENKKILDIILFSAALYIFTLGYSLIKYIFDFPVYLYEFENKFFWVVPITYLIISGIILKKIFLSFILQEYQTEPQNTSLPSLLENFFELCGWTFFIAPILIVSTSVSNFVTFIVFRIFFEDYTFQDSYLEFLRYLAF